MTTCVTLNCPFILYCKEYNYLVDRGDSCEHLEQIIKKAKRFDSLRKKAKAWMPLPEPPKEETK